MSYLREYFKLARVHSAVLTGLAPVLGALAVGMFDLYVLIIIFAIGFCTHIFGFVFNEYMDVDIDRGSDLLKDKPLVKGSISTGSAIIFAISGIIIGYFLIGYLAWFHHPVGIFGWLFFSIAWISIGVYDITSKSACCADFALAAWTGTLCLFGGFAVSNEPPLLLYIIAGLAFFQLVIQNILAGLKDLIQDQKAYGTTTPLRMGVRLKKKSLIIPSGFQVNIYGFKFVHLILVFIPFMFHWLSANIVQLFIIILLLNANFIIVIWIFNSNKFNRNNLMRAIGLHEILSYSIVPVMYFGIIDVMSVIFLIIFPIIWLIIFLKIIYGRLLPGI
jgi:4-hydroxybenzoate polyprenyltransferase